jgi:thioesterase domain-containing protein
MKKVQPEGPYYFGGASFGGLVAYEIALRLRERKEEAAVVALFDTYAPGYLKLLPGKSRLSFRWSQFVQRVEHHVGTLRILEPSERWPYIVVKAKKARNLLRRRVRNTRKRMARSVLSRLGRPLPEALRETQNVIDVASRSYRPGTYSGEVTLFRADKQPSGIYPDPTLGWGKLVTGRLDVHEVPGTHGTLVVEPRVRFLVEKLEPYLERVESSEPAMAVGD